MSHQDVIIDLSNAFPNESSQILNDSNAEDATEKGSDDDIIACLIEWNETSVKEGDDGTSISKSLANIESQIHRRSERLENKEKKMRVTTHLFLS